MLTAKKTKNHRARLEGLILPETWGPLSSLRCPFHALLWQETAKHDPTNGTAASNCRRCFANFTWRTQWTSRQVGMPTLRTWWLYESIWNHMTMRHQGELSEDAKMRTETLKIWTSGNYRENESWVRMIWWVWTQWWRWQIEPLRCRFSSFQF